MRISDAKTDDRHSAETGDMQSRAPFVRAQHFTAKPLQLEPRGCEAAEVKNSSQLGVAAADTRRKRTGHALHEIVTLAARRFSINKFESKSTRPPCSIS